MKAYVDRVGADIESAADRALEHNLHFHPQVDTVYLGGGTPSTLEPELLAQLLFQLREYFEVLTDAEVTVECAPGTLSDAMLQGFGRWGVNRVSFGVQSFADRETASVGRLHSRRQTLEDIARVREVGIENINLDLIAGLPHQTAESWRQSVRQLIDTGAPHCSVYMLEVDEHSRLGRELVAGGTRYHAHHVPDPDVCADFYSEACQQLELAGRKQYEISNFAKPKHESRHNLKYWTRRPYLGFGLDAHSMLLREGGPEAIRFATQDQLDDYLQKLSTEVTPVDRQQALEESFFLGLRLVSGVDLNTLAIEFGEPALAPFQVVIQDLVQQGLLRRWEGRIALTPRGRLLANEVFSRFIIEVAA